MLTLFGRRLETIWGMALCAVPVIFAGLRLAGRGYIFSALTTLSCAALIALVRPFPASYGWLIAGLLASALGHYWLSHTGGRDTVFAMGVGGFLVGHVFFVVAAAQDFRFRPAALVIGLILIACYAPYCALRVLPKTPEMLRIPVAAYALVSLVGFTFAMMTGKPLYILAIAFLLFSDTMIAEADFVRNAAAKPLILPTYYPCHILIALSAIFH